jgi:hypothetical protein
MRAYHHSKLVCGAMLLMASCVGCASLTGDPSRGKKKDGSWSWFKKKEYQVPQSINVTWSHDIFTAEGKIPTRGFGGRLYFYNERNQAIPVEGELTVYGFDDTHRDHRGMAIESADKRFKFTPEQFTTHFSESDLGASYSIWIPWDQAPGESKKIMLIPTFKTKEGRLIKGNAASVLLPGPPGSDQFPEVIQASAKTSNSTSYPSSYPSSNSTPSTGASPQLTTQPAATQRTTTLQMPRHIQSRPQISSDQAAAMLRQVYEADQQSAKTHALAAANLLETPAEPALAAMPNHQPNPAVVLASASDRANSQLVGTAQAAFSQPTSPAAPSQWPTSSPSQWPTPTQSSQPSPVNHFPQPRPMGREFSQPGLNGQPSATLETSHGPGWSVTQSRGSALSLNHASPERRTSGGFSGPKAFQFTQPSASQSTAIETAATNGSAWPQPTPLHSTEPSIHYGSNPPPAPASSAFPSNAYQTR